MIRNSLVLSIMSSLLCCVLQAEETKNVKPHFVGARSPESRSQKKKATPTKIKNAWVTSKTHPKSDKKSGPAEEQQTASTTNRPYLNRTGANGLLANNDEGILVSEEICCEEEEVCVYPVLGTFAPCGHVYVTGDWLYWRTRQGGMEYAVEGASGTPVVLNGAAPSKVTFDFESGFRVGLGVHLPHDGWDVNVNYTDFRPSASDDASGSIFPLLLYQQPIALPLVASARAEWDIDFQMLNVEIGRAYYIGRTLAFRPFIGLAGAWIDQEVEVHYSSAEVKTSSDFSGAGPRIGLGSNWFFGGGFSLFGNLSAALLAGHFDLKQDQNNQGFRPIHLNSDLNLVNSTAQMILGLAWDKNFSRDRSHFGIDLGFESQYWWRQNQMERFTTNTLPTFVRADSDLAFYGLTLQGRFDF